MVSALLYQSKGDDASAEKLLKRALTGFEKVLGCGPSGHAPSVQQPGGVLLLKEGLRVGRATVSAGTDRVSRRPWVRNTRTP